MAATKLAKEMDNEDLAHTVSQTLGSIGFFPKRSGNFHQSTGVQPPSIPGRTSNRKFLEEFHQIFYKKEPDSSATVNDRESNEGEGEKLALKNTIFTNPFR